MTEIMERNKYASHADSFAREVLKEKYGLSSRYLYDVLADKVIVPMSARIKKDFEVFTSQLSSLKNSLIEAI